MIRHPEAAREDSAPNDNVVSAVAADAAVKLSMTQFYSIGVSPRSGPLSPESQQ